MLVVQRLQFSRLAISVVASFFYIVFVFALFRIDLVDLFLQRSKLLFMASMIAEILYFFKRSKTPLLTMQKGILIGFLQVGLQLLMLDVQILKLHPGLFLVAHLQRFDQVIARFHDFDLMF